MTLKFTDRHTAMALLLVLTLVSVAGAAQAGPKVVGTVEWPEKWVVFGPIQQGNAELPPEKLATTPNRLEIGGTVFEPRQVDPGRNHLVALADIYKNVGRYTEAYVFLELNSADRRTVTLGMGSNWWMQAWLNGELVHDTTETSNIYAPIAPDNYLVDVELRKGRNVLAVRHICGSGGTEIALAGPDQLREMADNRLPPPMEIDTTKTLWDASVFDETLAATVGEGLILRLERNYVRPGERYLEFFLKLDSARPLDENRVRVAVFDLATGAEKSEEIFVPEDSLLLRRLDLRAINVPKARLRVELLQGHETKGAAEATVVLQSAEPAPAGKETVPVALNLPNDEASVRDWPVTFGVPFPAGSLWHVKQVRLVDREGNDVPCQATITGRWAPDGAIKWVRFDTLADSARGLAVAAGTPGEGATPASPVTVSANGGSVNIDTGTAHYVIERGSALFREIRADDGRILSSGGGRGLYVVDQRDRTATAAAEDAEIEVESRGPIEACIRIAGAYRTPQGEELARHITRIRFYAGRPEARVIHTLILTRDTNEIRFREIGWEIPVVPGRRPRSLFNTAAETPSLYAEVPLGDDAASAYLFQAAGEKLTLRPHPTRRRWFAGPRGEYRYVLATSDRRGHSNVVKNGERMGDWMALAGDEGGLVMACRDASRQHPKEFEVFPDRLAMRLFSHRGGDELDFRFEALVQRWGLTELDEDRLAPEDFKTIAAHESNAIGWSRTHELLVSPLPSEDPAATAVQLGRRHSREVFAHVDPHWIHRSRAMGPVYPKNTERFPEAERMVEHYMREYGTDFTPDRGYLGFVDYFAGPHYYYPGRWHQVYDVLTGYWTAYARSGDRDYRRIARGAAHAYFDCRLAHCDGPNKVRGLINYPGGAVFTGKSSLPYYWGDYTNYYQGNSSDLQRLLWDYYLTGYRRSRDLVEDYGEGLLRAWRPGRQVFCIRYVVRMLYQTYELTFDPRLRVLAEATASKEWYEPASEVLGTKNQPYRCTLYKTPFDMDIPVEIWRLTGARRYGKMAQAQARHNWRQTGVAGRQSGLGANFYYDQTGSPRVAADLFHFLRKQAGDSWQPEDESYIGITWSNLTRVMRGIPYAMDVVAATDADRKPLVSMLDFEVEGDTSKVFFSTDAQQATDMLLRRPAGKPYGTGLALVCHAFHGRRRASGQMLYRVTYSSSGSAEVRVPYDAMPGTYEIGLERPGPYTLIADRRTPLVVNPAGPWKPAYTRPGTKFYFKVPAGATEARIRFENGAILYGPDDIARNGGKPVRDWYELPGDNPGLWAFELTAPGAVEGHNFPAFFAMDDQSFYFEPEIVER